MTDAAFLVPAVLVVAIALVAGLVLMRRRRVDGHRRPAGRHGEATRTGGSPAGRGTEPAPRPQVKPARAGGRRSLLRPNRRTGQAPPSTWPVEDPMLTSSVRLEAAYQQSVYHGYRTDGRFRVAVRAATARGRSHAHDGTAGQDVAGVTWNASRRAVFAVVADGLGAKTDSGQIAREVVDQLLGLAEQLGPVQDPVEMIHQVIRATEHTAAGRDVDGATTMVVAEIRPDAGSALVSTWGIGDSEAWLLQDGAWNVLHHERRSDAENVTRHVPGHREIHTKLTRVRPGAVVALASDGFATALATDGNSPVARELIDRWRRPPSPTDFLNQVNFDDPRFQDDRAAVAVWIR